MHVHVQDRPADVLEQCGMEIHIKKPTDKKAKTVAMLAALPPAVYDGLWPEEGGAATYGGTDLSDINVTINDIANCTIPVVNTMVRRNIWARYWTENRGMRQM